MTDQPEFLEDCLPIAALLALEIALRECNHDGTLPATSMAELAKLLLPGHDHALHSQITPIVSQWMLCGVAILAQDEAAEHWVLQLQIDGGAI